MSFDFGSLMYRRPIGRDQLPKPSSDPSPECIGTRLDTNAVLELWWERSAIQETENRDLIHWHHTNTKSDNELRRACELVAASELSLTRGRYVESIIRPHLTRGT